MTDPGCTHKKSFCQVCGYCACMEAPVEILHCNPPLHTMSPDGQAAVRAIADAVARRMDSPASLAVEARAPLDEHRFGAWEVAQKLLTRCATALDHYAALEAQARAAGHQSLEAWVGVMRGAETGGARIIAGLKEAVAVARGDDQPGRVHVVSYPARTEAATPKGELGQIITGYRNMGPEGDYPAAVDHLCDLLTVLKEVVDDVPILKFDGPAVGLLGPEAADYVGNVLEWSRRARAAVSGQEAS